MKNLSFPTLLALGAGLFITAPAHAADLFLGGSDTGATNSSFTNPYQGSPVGWHTAPNAGTHVGPPTAGNDYFVTDNRDLRTPADTGSHTFAGDSLNFVTGTRFLLRDGGADRTITVNNLVMDGGLVWALGTNAFTDTLAGNIRLDAATQFQSGGANRVLDISANIGGTGAFQMTGGRVHLSGSNTYTGGTTVTGTDGVFLTMLGASMPGASTGSLTMTGTGGSTGPTLALSTSANTTVGSLSGTGNSRINGGGAGQVFTVNQTVSGTFAGVIGGAATPFTLGSLSTASLTLTGTNVYQGTTTIDGGTLIVGNGASGSVGGGGTAGVVVNAGTIGGSRTTGNNIVNFLTVGDGIGTGDAIITAGTNGTTGRLAMGGDLTLSSDAQFVFDLFTTSGGVSNDLVVVGNGVGLTTINGGAFFTFQATGDNSGISLGQQFTAINGGSFGGLGHFSNLADGGIISDNGVFLQASYAGGDLVLTVVPEPSAIWLVLGGAVLLTVTRARRRATSAA